MIDETGTGGSIDIFIAGISLSFFWCRLAAHNGVCMFFLVERSEKLGFVAMKESDLLFMMAFY